MIALQPIAAGLIRCRQAAVTHCGRSAMTTRTLYKLPLAQA